MNLFLNRLEHEWEKVCVRDLVERFGKRVLMLGGGGHDLLISLQLLLFIFFAPLPNCRGLVERGIDEA